MAQFVVYYPRYWSGTASQTAAPSGSYAAPLSPDPGPGEQWTIIGQYTALSDAYTACDAAAGTYLARVYDSDNQADVYAKSPALSAIVAGGNFSDATLRFQTTKMDAPTYAAWERVRIQNEVWAQVVIGTNDAGVQINIFRQPVLTGFYTFPTNSNWDTAAWIAILQAATVRTRTSGQTAPTVAALLESWG
jgi:hypothetical protein